MTTYTPGLMQSYYNDINRFRTMTREEERTVGRRARHGSRSAKNELVTANLRFVVDVAKKYSHCGVPFQELVAEGNMGLMRAADKFDERRGIKFISYAVWWIKQSIHECIKNKAKDNFVEIPMVADKGDEALEDEMTVGEVNKNEALFSTMEDEHEKEVEDENKRMVRRLMTVLDEREKGIISDLYGLDERKPLNMEEIAGKLGLTNERVRQIKEKALRKMKSEALMVEKE